MTVKTSAEPTLFKLEAAYLNQPDLALALVQVSTDHEGKPDWFYSVSDGTVTVTGSIQSYGDAEHVSRELAGFFGAWGDEYSGASTDKVTEHEMFLATMYGDTFDLYSMGDDDEVDE